MSNVIQFLDAMGRSPLSPAEYASAVSLLDVGAKHRQALLERDQESLAKLMAPDQQGTCCLVFVDEANH